MFGSRTREIAEEAMRKANLLSDESRETQGLIRGHIQECGVLNKAMNDKLDGLGNTLDKLSDSNVWQMRGIITVLLMTIGAILLEIFTKKGIF